MKKQSAEKEEIKKYWENNAPQTWYSNKNSEANELSYYNEIAYKRYHTYYSFIPSIAEFEFHPGEKVLEIVEGSYEASDTEADKVGQVLEKTLTAIDFINSVYTRYS